MKGSKYVPFADAGIEDWLREARFELVGVDEEDVELPFVLLELLDVVFLRLTATPTAMIIMRSTAMMPMAIPKASSQN